MTVQRLTAGDIARVQRLSRGYPFKPYRNYRVMPRKAQEAVLLADIDATLGHGDGEVYYVDEPGEAAMVLRRLPWETTFFGVPMARIEYVLGEHPEALRKVLQVSLDALRTGGVRHVSARVDVADLATVALLEQHGFGLMDALVTYVQRPRKEPANDVRDVGQIRPIQPEDGPELVEIARTAYRGFRGRFHFDRHLPSDRADEFYIEWARQCVRRRMAETVFVSEGLDGRLLGFLAFRQREPVSSVSGVPLFGGGLGACRPDAPGAYAGLIRAGTIWAHERDGVAECQTQNYNFPVIRIYEAVGAHYVRAEYALHAWIGPRRTAADDANAQTETA